MVLSAFWTLNIERVGDQMQILQESNSFHGVDIIAP